MSSVFDSLPGIEVPVGEINHRLDLLWTDTAAHGGAAPSAEEAKATQVNFVLHFGLNATPEDAAEQFRIVIRFARRYPSRIVVLCPLLNESKSTGEMRAKIYGECFLGKSKSDKRCVEFVILSYPMATRRFLEDEVSVCLSADLPTYYWAHRFSASGRLADYRFLLTSARRVIIDSSVAPADALAYPWPRPETLRDLAHARTLPVRQSIGQFLSAYRPQVLNAGLRGVTVRHSAALAAEGRALVSWLRARFEACAAPTTVEYLTEVSPGADASLEIRFAYDGSRNAFRWTGNLQTRHALFEAEYDGARTRLPAAVTLLSPEDALSEAMFF